MMMRKHLVEIRDVKGRITHAERFVFARSAEEHARFMRSPFHDVLINGDVVHAHTPPDQFVAGLNTGLR